MPVLDGDVCLKAGPDCVYQDDGTIRISFMDFEAKAAYCRPNQVTRLEIDTKYRRRICCDPSPGAKTIDLPPLCPANCALEEDGVTPQKWSLTLFTPDLICKPGFYIFAVDTSNGKKCCCMEEKSTTTSTTESTSSKKNKFHNLFNFNLIFKNLTATSTTSSTTSTTSSKTKKLKTKKLKIIFKCFLATSTTVVPTTSSTTTEEKSKFHELFSTCFIIQCFNF